MMSDERNPVACVHCEHENAQHLYYDDEYWYWVLCRLCGQRGPERATPAAALDAWDRQNYQHAPDYELKAEMDG